MAISAFAKTGPTAEDLFTYSGFNDRKLFRCALDAYKDSNGFIADSELFQDMFYAGWTAKGSHTFDPDKAANVKTFKCSSDYTDVNLTGLNQFANLETIYLSSPYASHTNVAPLATFSNLKNLYIMLSTSEISDISDLAELTNLEQLVISSGSSINDMSPISNLSNLKKLSLYSIWTTTDHTAYGARLSDLSFLSELINLETLDLRGNDVTDLSLTSISNLTNLKYLAVSGNENITPANPLFNLLTNLEYLDIRDPREDDFAQEGDASVHPGFNDGVLYKAVVDSYYREQGEYPLGDEPFFKIEYDKATHRKEILTDEQLASIETLMNLDGTPWASRTPKLTDSTGLNLLPNVKSIIFDMMMVKTPNVDLSGNPKLETFISFASSPVVETIDFSHNPELRYVNFWQSFVQHLDFSNNPKLQKLIVWSSDLESLNISNNPALTQIDIMGSKVKKLALPDKTNLKDLWLTGFAEGAEAATTSAIHVTPGKSVKLRAMGGRGGEGDEEPAEAEPYILDVSSLEFIQNSNTNIDGILENETITAKDPSCYTYDAGAKAIVVKASCVDDGLKFATLVHSYTINGVDYVNEFDIDFNFEDDESADDTPTTPNTGFFTKEDSGVNVANIAITLAGISILTFIALGLRSRLSAKSRVRKF
ncbi:hypothetical protein IKF74_01590 [Candidatus Saccharibacteria bacterium]|nr:hypothetical protein [Candidatus Saccharibacteria bacterium]